MRPCRRGEAGTTLIEVLATVMVMSIAFIGLLGGLWTAVATSSTNVKLSTAEATLRAYGEFMKRQPYASCPATYPNGTFFSPQGYVPTVTSILYWNPSANPPAFGSCTSPDGGMQLLTLSVSYDGGASSETIQVVKRR